MSEQSRPDRSNVYHQPSQNGAHKPSGDDGPVRPPRRFALCAALLTEHADADGTSGENGSAASPSCTTLPLVESVPPEEIDVLDLEEIVMWGLEGADGTFVCGRNPYTRRHLFGTFDSAERARAFYSRWGLLRLVYA